MMIRLVQVLWVTLILMSGFNFGNTILFLGAWKLEDPLERALNPLRGRPDHDWLQLAFSSFLLGVLFAGLAWAVRGAW